MNDILVQTVLAARKSKFEDWVNILFVLGLAVFWVLGGVIKARTAGKGKREDEEQLPGRPARRPPERARGPQRQTFQRPHPRRTVGPAQQRPVAPEYAAKTEKGSRVRHPEMPELSKLPLSMPSVQPEQKEVWQPVSKPVVERLLDPDDPDKLKRAILHYEILGKPVSLRSPAEQR
jgi:hypothetical protein